MAVVPQTRSSSSAEATTAVEIKNSRLKRTRGGLNMGNKQLARLGVTRQLKLQQPVMHINEIRRRSIPTHLITRTGIHAGQHAELPLRVADGFKFCLEPPVVFAKLAVLNPSF